MFLCTGGLCPLCFSFRKCVVRFFFVRRLSFCVRRFVFRSRSFSRCFVSPAFFLTVIVFAFVCSQCFSPSYSRPPFPPAVFSPVLVFSPAVLCRNSPAVCLSTLFLCSPLLLVVSFVRQVFVAILFCSRCFLLANKVFPPCSISRVVRAPCLLFAFCFLRFVCSPFFVSVKPFFVSSPAVFRRVLVGR